MGWSAIEEALRGAALTVAHRWIRWDWKPYNSVRDVIRDPGQYGGYFIPVEQAEGWGLAPPEWTKENRQKWIPTRDFKDWYQELENRSYKIAREVMDNPIPDPDPIGGRVFFYDIETGVEWTRKYSHDQKTWVPYGTP